jgi:hypothetical protein
MAIDELLRAVAPPAQPLETGDAARWAEVEHLLGTRLPRDLYDLATRYGSGCFDPLGLEVFNPFAPSYPNQLRYESGFLRVMRGLSRRQPFPYGVFPERPGWLSWGRCHGCDCLCWVTEGEPDAWLILIPSDHCRHFQQLGMPLTSFLASLFTGGVQAFFAIQTGFIQTGFTFDERIVFVPSRRPHQAPPAGAPSSRDVWDADGPPCPWEGEWFPPDELGRPTGVRVILGPGRRDSSWNGFAAEGFTVYPDWWCELPEPRRRWRRGQLLGWRLGGPAGTALHNMIPLTWAAQTSMWAHERSVAGEVHKGSRKICTVRVTYEGANRYPATVRFQDEYVPGFPMGSGVFDWTIHNT